MILPCALNALLPVAVPCLAAQAPGTEALALYVAPDGNDAWSGHVPEPNAAGADGPLATLTRARDAIRELRRAPGGLPRPVEVRVRGGTYVLREPFVLTPEDSGTAECPVTYEAYRDERPVISGGRAITGWKRTKVNGQAAWTVVLPEVQRGEWTFRQLWVNGERRERPRLPKEGYYFFTGLPEVTAETQWGQGQTQATFAPGEIANWRNLNDVEVMAFHLWTESRLPIASVDEAQQLVTFAKRSVFRLTLDFANEPGRYYVENVSEALDTPGQWYLDRPTGTLTYLPLPGEKPDQAEVVAPVIPQLVLFSGDPAVGLFVEHIRMQGLTFSHTQWDLPADAAGYGQAANGVPAVIQWQGARHCTLRECTVEHAGNYAVELIAPCEDNRVSRCTLQDLGAGGVKIGHDTTGTEVSDCTIAHGGRLFTSAVGVWIGNSRDNRVVHNEIADLYYTGVSLGWTWGYAATTVGNNHIEYNHIHDIGHGVLSDMGGIYSLGIQPGTRLCYNRIHDVESYAYGGWGLYTDEGSSQMLLENNVVYRTKTGGFHQHYGEDNTVRNNVFAFAKVGQLQRTREEDHLSFTFERNIVYWTEGPLLHGSWQNNNYRLDYNCYWQAAGQPFDFAGRTLEQWRELGQDAHSLVADPKFADPAQGDFTLAADSPALQLGFVPIDLSEVGPRP